MTRNVPWPRVFAEGLAIVLSILLAFGIQAWWDDRGQQATADDYLRRLELDLRQDTSVLTYLLEGLGQKHSALLALQIGAGGDIPEVQLADLLLQAEQYGWGQFTVNGTTFEDLRSTGNLQLIRDTRLRAALVDYYDAWDLEQGRIASRRGRLPEMVYKLLPIGFSDATQQVAIDELRAPDFRQLGDRDMPPLTDAVVSNDFRRELQHELNYTGFVQAALERLNDRASDVLRLF